MITTKNRLDYLVKEEQKTHTLGSFKTKKRPDKKVKDISTLLEKTASIENQRTEQTKNIVGNIEKKTRPLKTIPEHKKKPVVWL